MGAEERRRQHYRQLIESGASLRADRFEDVVAGIERCLEAPGELAEERRRVVHAVVGMSRSRRPAGCRGDAGGIEG